jgi:hypothetical protein
MHITKADRVQARQMDGYTWHLIIDGRDRRAPEGTFEAAGPLSPECAAELRALVRRWIEDGRF